MDVTLAHHVQVLGNIGIVLAALIYAAPLQHLPREQTKRAVGLAHRLSGGRELAQHNRDRIPALEDLPATFVAFEAAFAQRRFRKDTA